MSDAPEVLFEKRDHVACLTLNRPHRGNSLTGSMMPVIREMWAEVRDDPWIRAAIVIGAGERHFCTGADVHAVAGRGGMSTGNGPLTDEVFWSPRQNRVWKPVISAVNGLVAGAGLHFVVDADIVLAADHAAFMDTHVNVGLVGAMENIGLAKRLPLGSALRMTLMGKSYRMPAQRAYQLGLVDELSTSDELMAGAEEMAQQIARNSPAAVQLSKQAVWNSLETGYGQACEYGWSLLRMHWAHPDAKEGPRAFAEGREPRWTTGADGEQ
ncbi:enoyl-CoA hydratase/isomerase family protein [Amycolatopsis rubida]|uniref:Enoyl-CoA hydratase/carnithine racemase n=1 Tax=Amycolatopsis rubida TaxID=112413 RepID=A0A1I6AQ58_9PSEU|nr:MULTISPECIES: enoyl-CoA hydratase-related protein [Amycolatopsis]MYW98009.1 enoyl-CoA hydratase/isomerase family protein [Amycolatopsis rubida]NEC62994.1 enoyl-CoA hydratase/isomerase family protein [Amycolatopsis rubida]OAP24493.1 Carnitinyl-CoA dehydratase [Amycolatopsis sp. M39]SFQ70824.1 Enoyl-CoA hydratase/carnithine racemase [Amycolatopsis rubida]